MMQTRPPNSEEEDSFAEESDITKAFEREMVEVASVVEDLEDTLDVQDVEDRDQSSSHTNTQTHKHTNTQTHNTRTHTPQPTCTSTTRRLTQQCPFFCVCAFVVEPQQDAIMMAACDGDRRCERRRERRLRSWWRHDRMSIACALAKPRHHPAPKVGAEPYNAPQSQKTASAGARPWSHSIPRRSWLWSARVSRAPVVRLLSRRRPSLATSLWTCSGAGAVGAGQEEEERRRRRRR